MALQELSAPIDARTERQSSIHPIVILGAHPSGNSKYDSLHANLRGYVANAKFIIDTLGSPTVITATTNPHMEGQSPALQKARSQFTQWSELVKTGNLPFHIDRFFETPNISALAFPKNILVPISQHHTFSTNEAAENLIEEIFHVDGHHRVTIDDTLASGGRYVGAETGPLVFVGLSANLSHREHLKTLQQDMFAGRTVVPVMLPREVGVTDTQRVLDHIDQFIADPLPFVGDTEYVIPLDEKYHALLRNHGVILPAQTSGGQRITYFDVGHNYTSANYVLNTVGSPTGHIFIEPDLQHALQEAGLWDNIDKNRVKVMPSNTAADDRTGGGAGCKIVIAAA